MTTTGTIVTTLATRDLRALRNADTLVFVLRDGQSAIRATRAGEHTATGYDETHTVHTDTRVNNYGRMGTFTATHVELHARFDLPLRTLLSRMRAGDTLTLRWTRDNDNENMRSIGWHRDELHVGIRHAKGKDEEYLVAVYVGPDNTARMVRTV